MAELFEYEGIKRTETDLMAYFEESLKVNRFKITYNLIEGTDNRILDIGCGPGYLSDLLSDKISEYVGTDLIKNNIALAKHFFKSEKRTFVSEDIFVARHKVLKKDYFDYALLLELIEHVDNPMEFIKKSAEFLKSGGHVIISTPNATSITNILFNIKKRKYIIKDFSFTGTETDHIYAWDRLTLQNLLVKIGFKITEVRLSRPTIFRGQSIIIKAQKT